MQHFWNELCFHCKSVSVCPLLRSVATLKSGLWAIRGLSNHGLGPLQAIAMAKYFAHRAAELGNHYKLDYNCYCVVVA